MAEEQNKPIKMDGDLKYMGIVIPSMMTYIARKDGMTLGYARNHHTVQFDLSTGETLISHAYETKTMIIIDWYIAEYRE